MVVVRSPVRSCVRSVVRDVFGVVDGQTDLQRILALSPSLLVWPAQGAGWQGTSGGTLAASGQPLGLGVDLAALGGKTLSEWLAAPTTSELATPGAWTVSAGCVESPSGTLTFSSNGATATQSSKVTSGKVYRYRFTASGTGTLQVYCGLISAADVDFTIANPSGEYDLVLPSGASGDGIQFRAASSGGFVGAVSAISVRELPGNHLRAGTWASPSDAARGTFQNNAINLDGVNDYYSLLNAISITTDMTVVRAFKRASAGIRSIGLGTASINLYDAYWLTDNTTATALGNAGAIVGTANTSTGSFVFSSVRNAATTLVRRNGAQIGSTTAPGVANSFGAVGLMNTVYNSGEISFLAVFPTELTGANLALVEQIAASTNGSVLA